MDHDFFWFNLENTSDDGELKDLVELPTFRDLEVQFENNSWEEY